MILSIQGILLLACHGLRRQHDQLNFESVVVQIKIPFPVQHVKAGLNRFLGLCTSSSSELSHAGFLLFIKFGGIFPAFFHKGTLYRIQNEFLTSELDGRGSATRDGCCTTS